MIDLKLADYDTDYLGFEKRGVSDSGRTEVWEVVKRNGFPLGAVRWYGPWRCYVFYPEAGTLFNSSCSADIATFLARLTARQRDESLRKPT